jgi:hypothetical protein
VQPTAQLELLRGYGSEREETVGEVLFSDEDDGL